MRHVQTGQCSGSNASSEARRNGEFSLTKDITYPTTSYAILSHTWGEDDEEVNFGDLKDGSGKMKEGYCWPEKGSQ
jgi:hypothetical protein